MKLTEQLRDFLAVLEFDPIVVVLLLEFGVLPKVSVGVPAR